MSGTVWAVAKYFPTFFQELGDLIKKRSKLELQVQDMKSEMETNDQTKKEKKKKIEDINADIAKTQAKLDEITPKVRGKDVISYL